MQIREFFLNFLNIFRHFHLFLQEYCIDHDDQIRHIKVAAISGIWCSFNFKIWRCIHIYCYLYKEQHNISSSFRNNEQYHMLWHQCETRISWQQTHSLTSNVKLHSHWLKEQRTIQYLIILLKLCCCIVQVCWADSYIDQHFFQLSRSSTYMCNTLHTSLHTQESHAVVFLARRTSPLRCEHVSKWRRTEKRGHELWNSSTRTDKCS